MTTTRIQDVAKFCCSSHEDHVYAMKPLSTDDSRTLLLKRTFHQESDCPAVLEEVVHEILKKCGGLPLAIINIGSLLARKPVTRREWEKVHSSIGSALEKDQDLEVIKRILFLSYDDLPHQLKICLLYLSVFPEDFEIDRERLVWRWIAEGFISKQHGQSLEETGERCFNELMNRNMIQPVDIDYSGTPRACRVHDIMLDLIIKVSTEENFATLVVSGDTRNLPSRTVRRLSLQGKCEEDITWPGTCSLGHVRSLTVHGTFNQIPPLQDLEVLRVLDLQDWHDTGDDDCTYADHIGGLNQLRYLCLGKSSSISEVPRQIGRLKNLQTLDLRACTQVKELPASITELGQLVRLLVWSGVRFPQGIGRMRSLEELSKIDGSSNTGDVMLELGALTRLARLRVGWNPSGPVRDEARYKRSLAAALRSLGEHSLRSLRVDYYQNEFYSVDFLVDTWQPVPGRLQSLEIFGPIYFTRAPPWMAALSDLTCLSINIGRVEPRDVEVIRAIPALLFLYLYTKQPPEETLAVGCGGFRCLKEFLFFPYHKDGRSLRFEAGAMPGLQSLSLGFVARDDLCGGDGAFDFGIRHLTCLRKVEVVVFCNRARAREVEAAEAAVRGAVEALPNRPTLKMRRYFQDKMLRDVEDDG